MKFKFAYSKKKMGILIFYISYIMQKSTELSAEMETD